jgi:putative adhesin
MSTSISRMAILAASLALAAQAAHAGTFQQQVAADPSGEVDVSNISGDIVITGWDKPAVSVNADLSGDSNRVKVRSSHGRTSICVTYNSRGCNSPGSSDNDSFGEDSSVRLEIYVPRGSEVDVSGVSSDIKSSGVEGAQQLRTVSGDINAELGSGDDEVQSVSGEVHLKGSGHAGRLRVTSVSGDVTVTNVAGELEARTVNGTLQAGLATARMVRLNTTSGDMVLSARLDHGGTVESETVSGSQRIRVDGGYAYEAKTFSGDITDCFGQKSERTSEYGPGRHLDGTRGTGDGHIRLQSLSGDISLCDR